MGVSDDQLSSIDSPGNNMACMQGTCRCQTGFINVNSKCIRALQAHCTACNVNVAGAMCTIGMKSEPLSGADGLTLRCNPNSVTGQCPPNASCDPTFGVCCKTYQQQPNRALIQHRLASHFHYYRLSERLQRNGRSMPERLRLSSIRGVRSDRLQ